MKFIPEQDWQQKIANVNRLAESVSARLASRGFTPPELSDEDRDRVESATRFERYRGRVLRLRGRRARNMAEVW